MVDLSKAIESEMIIRIAKSRKYKKKDWLFKAFESCRFECDVTSKEDGTYFIQVSCFEKDDQDNKSIFAFKRVIIITSKKELQNKVNSVFLAFENFIYHFNKPKDEVAGEQDPFKYEIIKHIGVLQTDNNGFTKEVNLISFNGKPPVIDIRTWTPQRRMTRKGIALNRDAFFNLVDVLKNQTIEMGEEKWIF